MPLLYSFINKFSSGKTEKSKKTQSLKKHLLAQNALISYTATAEHVQNASERIIMITQDFIHFDDISFSYPGENAKNIFEHFTAQLPPGFISLVGPNASGKSTFMLLASGRLMPQQGKATLFGENLCAMPEEQRNALASVIYQNMEFESTDATGDILEQVGEKGEKNKKTSSNISHKEIISVFELQSVLTRPLHALSKGEMQRTLLACAVLYGSRSLFMDEPLFALEARQKESALEYLKHYSKEHRIPVYISLHELELSRKYAENILLFYPNRDIDFGTPEEVLTKESLEKSYAVPMSMLKDSENLNRKILAEQAQLYAESKKQKGSSQN